MLFLTPLLLLVFSGTVVAVIVVRHWREAALMDVEGIPEVKEQRTKEQILQRRIEAKAMAAKDRWRARFAPVGVWFDGVRSQFRGYVRRIEREVFVRRKHEQQATRTAIDPKQVSRLLDQARAAVDAKAWQKAEEAYISVLRLDEKNIEAYRGLASVYYEQDELQEAAQTYAFLTHLDPSDDAVFMRLGDIAMERRQYDTAVTQYQQAILLNPQLSSRYAKLADALRALDQYDTACEAAFQAVAIESENPKYLDNLIELAILSANKKIAEEAFVRLRMVNPENQKLGVLKEKIAALS